MDAKVAKINSSDYLSDEDKELAILQVTTKVPAYSQKKIGERQTQLQEAIASRQASGGSFLEQKFRSILGPLQGTTPENTSVEDLTPEQIAGLPKVVTPEDRAKIPVGAYFTYKGSPFIKQGD